jgi:hypothetical protein
MHKEVVCPVDYKSDSIQKVSAIVKGGTGTTTMSGPTFASMATKEGTSYGSGFTTLAGSSQTELAERLSPPNEPSRPNEKKGDWQIGCGYVSILPIIFFAFSFLNSGGTSGDLISALIYAVIPGLLIYYGYLARESVPGEMTIWKDKMNEWERNHEYWQQLYYCHKHDIVFHPVDGELGSA